MKKIKKGIALFVGLVGLVGGLVLSQHLYHKKIDLTAFNGTYLDKARAVSPFSLTGTDNKSFNNASLKGHWTFVFFGFTQCGYLCPTTMAELGKMYRLLEQQGVKPLPQVVMISIDPDRDDLIKLGQYVTAFHPAFYGARGPEKNIAPMTREMGIAYAKVTNKSDLDSQHYDVQHTGAIMLFNPEGQLNAFFTTPHHADLLAKDYQLLVS